MTGKEILYQKLKLNVLKTSQGGAAATPVASSSETGYRITNTVSFRITNTGDSRIAVTS